MKKTEDLKKANLYLQPLLDELKRHADPATARGQAAYMRNQFLFYGLKSEARRSITAAFFQSQGYPGSAHLIPVVKQLWELPQRDYQLIAQELVFRVRRKPQKDDLDLLEYMITQKSWWDTVDFIASTLMGRYFKAFPEAIEPAVERWLDSGNIWLQRSALLFQLKYKLALDTALLSDTISFLLGSNEFFINKAIGWILREYSKTNPGWVENFCDITPLNNLSKREAMRVITKQQ